MRLVLQYFRKAVRSFPKLFAISMLMAIFLTGLDVIMPWLLRMYLKILTELNSYYFLAIGIAFFALYLLVKVLVKTKWYVSLDCFGGKYIEKLSLHLQESLANTYYSEIEKVGPSITRNILFSDVLNMFRVIGHHVPSMLSAIIVIVACITITSVHSILTSVYIFCAALLGFAISWFSRKIIAKYAGNTNSKLKQHDSWCAQFVELLPLIQNHNIIDYYKSKTSANLNEFVETAVAEDKKSIFWSGLSGAYHTLFSLALSAILALPISGNSIPDLVFYTMVADIVMEQSQKIETMIQQIMKQRISFVHVDELLDLTHRTGTSTVNQIDDIDFVGVDYIYSNGVVALNNVSCKIEKGELIRLTGANGSGKSTFIKLLMGLYRCSNGKIFLNGVSIENFAKESINAQILYIDQDEQFLDESFKYYLELITSQNLDPVKYSDLCAQISLVDDGRVIQRNGKSLSVGQRKKLLLLKLLLGLETASVLILDEITAGLDAETTKQVYAQIKRVAESGKKIILVIDHNAPSDLDFTHTIRFINGTIEFD